MNAEQTPRRVPGRLWAALAAALALRLALAAATDGYPYDMSCFVAWGEKLLAEGPAAFYSEGYFADYPPGYLPVLALAAFVRGLFGWDGAGPLGRVLLAALPAVCDVCAAALVFAAARRRLGEGRAAWCLTLFTAFNPLFLFDTGIWKQIDGAFMLPLLLCFWLLEKRRWLPAAALYGLALAIKPQALLAGPVLAVCFLAGVADAWGGGARARLRAVGRCAGGAALALAVPLGFGLPFFGAARLLPSLAAKYFSTASGYPYATINAFNWFAALGGNWAPLQGGALPWGALGTVHILLLTLGLAALAVLSWRADARREPGAPRRFSPLLLAAFYLVGVFTLGHCMHERYLVPGVAFALLAAARWGDVRLYGAAFGLSLTGFLNLAAVYTQVGTDDEWLSSATSMAFTRVVGFAETAAFVLLAFTVYTICRHGAVSPLPGRGAARGRSLRLPGAELSAPPPQPRWTAREVLALLALTAATAALSFACLGDLTAPQHPMESAGTTRTETITPAADAAELWLYPGISTGGRVTVADAAGNVLFEKELDQGACFSWSRAACPAPAGQALTVTVENAQVFELALRDAAGALVPVTGGGALCDEQDAVPDAISQLNSMYFDEIYHGRTGYELLHGRTVYETTHPPLGKDLIMAGIALFGMTGFGWRFSGTLFGVLLVPLAWCFARRLTRKPWVGALAGALLALDFMRFAQSRIATIDVYATFFILLGAHCMLWYCQKVLTGGVGSALLPMALGGLAFGLGCAAKWTGIYAGAGLAVLYLGVLYARWRQRPPHFWAEFRLAGVGGVLFYVLLPFILYLAAYLPYLWRDPDFGLRDWWDCQQYMYWYHSTLEATHPFESRWFTWLLDLRPVWYYQNVNLPAGLKGSIAGLGGPVLWLAGLAAVLLILWRQVSARGSRAGAGVLILYGTQLIPWMLVARCTFLYHYFPSSMFCLAAVALVLARWRDERRAKRIGAGLLAASLVLFVWFYPVLSGLPVPDLWAQSLKILPSYGFY